MSDTPRQRIATYLALLTTLLALIGGVLLRNNVESAAWLFVDSKVGISARYPAGWLLERGDLDEAFVMKVQDPSALPFKTTLSITVVTNGPDATITDITDLLTVRRASQLSSYKTLTIEPTTFAGGVATRMTYAYATTDTNPALKSLPIIVEGIDVIFVVRGQTYIITFLSDTNVIDRNQRYFDLFLNRLELKR